METVRVLAYAGIGDRPCDLFRLGMYRDRLEAASVVVEPWERIGIETPQGFAGDPVQALRDGIGRVDLSPLERADVLLLRRWQHTAMACPACGRSAGAVEDLRRHAAATGHALLVPDPIIRPLIATLEARPLGLRHLAIVYETDDYLLDQPEWVGFRASLDAERDLIERIMRLADLVTVSTPRLATLLATYNRSIRVVRNAIDPDWYRPGTTDRAEPDATTIVFYGSAARHADYAVCRDAVDQVKREAGTPIRRVWLGGGGDAVATTAVDVALPYEHDHRAFARTLCDLAPDVGLAPLGRDTFASAKSELHWLEYTMAGAATVATRTLGDGPYGVVRDGVDGLLARNKQEWREQLRHVIRSTGIREQLVGRARERVLAEYDVRERAGEWARAFRWAAEHAGARGRAA